MKKRILTLLLAVLMLLSAAPLPALADSVDNYEVIHSNFNSYAVENDPPYLENLRLKSHDYLIQAISTYHWNYGRGATPGQIWVERDDGVTYGPWQAVGRSSNGIANATWDVFPTGFVMEHDHYYCVMDSDEETWSWNDASDEIGFYELRGQIYTGQAPAPAQPSSSASTRTGTLTYRRIHITIDGREIIPTDVNGNSVEPFIYNSSTYLPLRAVAGALGLDVSWEDAASTVTLDTGGTTTARYGAASGSSRALSGTLTFRNIKIVLDGQTVTPRDANGSVVEPFIYDGSTYLPVRALANALGLGVGWDNDTSTVILTSSGSGTPATPTTPATPAGATPGGSSEGPAQGTLTNGACSVSFRTMQNGEAVLVRDSNGCDLLLTDEMEGTVSVTFPAAAPTDGAENVVYLGVPCLDANGNLDFEAFPLDTTYANGNVTATADLSQYANAIEDAAYSGETATGKTDYSAAFAREQAAAVGSGVNVKTAVHFFCETEFLITSDAGHFRIYIPKSSYTTQSATVSGKINKEDGKRIVEDLEGILSFYQSLYKIKRTDWPMKVIYNTGSEDGVYGSGRMKLKWTALDNGYGRDMGSSLKLYETMAHEMFHFVQREYAPVALSQSWFDEAAGSYYGVQFGYQRCGNMETALNNENYSADAEAQYQGITPMDVSTLGWFDFLHAGYGRASFIEYLMKYHGGDFLKRYYEQGITLAGVQTESRLENLTGKSLGELAVDFYDKLVLEKDSVNGVLSTPSDIFDRQYRFGGDEGEASLDAVRTTWNLTGEKESTVISVPRYGAYFVALDMSKMHPGAKSFTLTVPTADCESRLIAIHSNNNEIQYDVQKVFKPANGKFENIPIDGTRYLLMMINNTGSWGWTVSETLEMTYGTLSKSGSYPSSMDEMPTTFTGKVRTWSGGMVYSHNDSKSNAVCDVEYENGNLSFIMYPDGRGNLDTMFVASRDGFLDSGGYKDCITSDGKHFYVQMEAGKYVNRNNGPKPTPEQLQEWEESANPFGYSIEGDSTTNVMRVIWFDRYGNMNVFEGEGYVDNGYYYDPEIRITASAGE